jgi:hypothetical protein
MRLTEIIEDEDSADDPIIWSIMVNLWERGIKLSFDIRNPRHPEQGRIKGDISKAEIVLMDRDGRFFETDDPRPDTFRVLTCDYWVRSQQREDGSWFPPFRDDFQLFQPADSKYAIKTVDGVKTLIDK